MGNMQTTPAVTTTTPQPGHYNIDPSRSQVTFATRHLFGLGRVKGSFAIRGGTVSGGSFTVRATARIDRTEFGITAARGLAARHLDLTVEAQCTRT
jgi:polyisoprenoid-binding protein YceI